MFPPVVEGMQFVLFLKHQYQIYGDVKRACISLVGETVALCVTPHPAQGKRAVTLAYVSGCAGIPWQRRTGGLHVLVTHYCSFQKQQLAAL